MSRQPCHSEEDALIRFIVLHIDDETISDDFTWRFSFKLATHAAARQCTWQVAVRW